MQSSPVPTVVTCSHSALLVCFLGSHLKWTCGIKTLTSASFYGRINLRINVCLFFTSTLPYLPSPIKLQLTEYLESQFSNGNHVFHWAAMQILLTLSGLSTLNSTCLHLKIPGCPCKQTQLCPDCWCPIPWEWNFCVFLLQWAYKVVSQLF